MKKQSITIPHHIFVTMLLESFRYCLGRMSYAVSNCVERLVEHWNELPWFLQEQIQKDISEAIKCGHAGMAMDVQEWEKILKLERVAMSKTFIDEKTETAFMQEVDNA